MKTWAAGLISKPLSFHSFHLLSDLIFLVCLYSLSVFLYTREPQIPLDSPPLPPYFFSPTSSPLFSQLPLLPRSSDLQPAFCRCNLPFLSSFLPLACPAPLPCEANVWALIQTSLVDPVTPFAPLQPCCLFSATNFFFFWSYFPLCFVSDLETSNRSLLTSPCLCLSLLKCDSTEWRFVTSKTWAECKKALGWPGPFSALEWV